MISVSSVIVIDVEQLKTGTTFYNIDV